MKKQTEEQIIELLLRLNNNMSHMQTGLTNLGVQVKVIDEKLDVLDHKVDNIIETLAPKLEQIEDHELRIGRLEAAT